MKKFVCALLVCVFGIAYGMDSVIKHGIEQHEDCSQYGDGTCAYNCCHQYNRCMEAAGEYNAIEMEDCKNAMASCTGRCNEVRQPMLYKAHINDKESYLIDRGY